MRNPGDLDTDRRKIIEADLMAHFLETREGASPVCRGDPLYKRVYGRGRRRTGETIATLDRQDLRHVLFEILPHKADIPLEDTGRVLMQLRAFYRFLSGTTAMCMPTNA